MQADLVIVVARDLSMSSANKSSRRSEHDNVRGDVLRGSEFFLNQPMQMLGYRWLIKTLDDFVQKAGD
jgi:hypothetical protein